MAQKSAQPGTSAEIQIPPGQHGKGFPPFDATTFASQLIWLTITFVLLYLLMSRIALPRMASIIESRSARIADDLGEAQRLKDQSDTTLAEYEQSLADARMRAQGLISDLREDQARAAETARKSLEGQLADRIGEAEKSIAASKNAAMVHVRGIAEESAGAIVERLIGKPPSAKEAADAVAAVLKN
jgi:F-type H+-transporting ATPase subunit b